MPRPIQIIAITAFVFAIVVMPFVATAFSSYPSDGNGTHLPSIHCKINPKIEGCDKHEENAKRHSVGISHSVPLIALISGAIVWVMWRVQKFKNPDDREKIVIGIVVALVLWACKHLLYL